VVLPPQRASGIFLCLERLEKGKLVLREERELIATDQALEQVGIAKIALMREE
jgi:hypothetical protein